MAKRFNQSDPTARNAIGNAAKTDRRRARVTIDFGIGHAHVTGPADLIAKITSSGYWSSKAGAWEVTAEEGVDIAREAERQRLEVIVTGHNVG